MIATGGHYRGPELSGSRIQKLLNAAMKALIQECGLFIGADDLDHDGLGRTPGRIFTVGSTPAVNVVFYVPGSLGGFDIPKIEASRFSRKKKLLLVAVPVPPEVAQAGGSVEFIIDALHKANAIAAAVFARKGNEPFDLARAEAIVEKVRQSLAAQAG